jgi:hypothetical protein
MCSLDGRSGTNIGAIPRERNKQAWKEHVYRPMRAGKDNLAISFIWGRSRKDSILEAAQKGLPARPQWFFTLSLKGSLVDPRLRALNEHLPSVRVPRAGGRPGYPFLSFSAAG